MDEPRKHDRVSPVQGDQAGNEAGPRRLAGPEAGPTSGLTSSLAAAMEGGAVDLRPVVQFLAARVWEAQHQLSRLDRRMDGMKRRVSELESELSRMAGRSSEHEESIRMMCAVLKDLDDPYGFGMSLDEGLAYDEADRTAEEEESIGSAGDRRQGRAGSSARSHLVPARSRGIDRVAGRDRPGSTGAQVQPVL